VFTKKVSIHTASRVSIRLAVYRVSRVRVGLASQASRVFLPGLAIHTATGEASRVYSISHLLNIDIDIAIFRQYRIDIVSNLKSDIEASLIATSKLFRGLILGHTHKIHSNIEPTPPLIVTQGYQVRNSALICDPNHLRSARVSRRSNISEI